MSAVLKLTDGTTTIDLINGNGFYLEEWTPGIPSYKQGGIWQDSPLADGRRLADRKYASVIENFSLKASRPDQDSLIRQMQEIRSLMEKATNYWVTDWQNEPVWIEARASCETNSRYALILFASIPQDDNPYASPFLHFGPRAIMDNLTLIVEHGHWLANRPGTGTCVEVSQEWTYNPLPDWVVRSADPVGNTWDFQEDSSNRLFATDGGTDDVLRSTDGGVNWSVVYSFPGSEAIRAVHVLANDYILAGSELTSTPARMVRSTNNGTVWNNVDTSYGYYTILQLADGDVLGLAEDGSADLLYIRESTDNGATWTTRTTLDRTLTTTSRYMYLSQVSNGDVWFADSASLMRSSDFGATWERIQSDAFSLTMGRVHEHTNGDLFSSTVIGVAKSLILRSQDDGDTWEVIYEIVGGQRVMYQFVSDHLGALWGTDRFDIYRSMDDGETWRNESTLPAGTSWVGMLQLANNMILCGDNGNVLSFQYETDFPIDLGRSETCTNEVYVANKHNVANLTHVKMYDATGPTFTDLMPAAAFPFYLLPAIPAAGDMIYFGCKSEDTERTGPFCSLVFDIGDIYRDNQTVVWEYWNGAWVTLTVQDNTEINYAAVNSLGTAGVNSVHWAQPSDWTTTAVDGVTGFWVRWRITALSYFNHRPTQQNRDIYSVNQPFIDIAADQIGGNFPSIIRMRVFNQSDKDGRGGSGPDLWDNRIIAGLRTYDRGSKFTPYINLADEQNPIGITITLGTNVAYANSGDMITGRRATWTAGMYDDTFADKFTIAFDRGIASHFYGRFHAFLRGVVTAGSDDDIEARITVKSASGGAQYVGPIAGLRTTTNYELLDLGNFSLPGFPVGTNQGDANEIIVQLRNMAGAGRTARFFDLILMPVDEWVIDAVDLTNTNDSIVGTQEDIGHFLDVDSVSDLRASVQSVVRTDDARTYITSVYTPITVGPAILQSGVRQRLWFLAARTSATGSTYSWIAEPWLAHSVQIVSSNDRYTSMRGDL